MDSNKKLIIHLVLGVGIGLFLTFVFSGILILKQSFSVPKAQASPGPECTVNDDLKVTQDILTHHLSSYAGPLGISGEGWGMHFHIDTDANSDDYYEWYSDGALKMSLGGNTGNLHVAGTLDVDVGHPGVCTLATASDTQTINVNERVSIIPACAADTVRTGGGCMCNETQLGEVSVVWSRPVVFMGLAGWECACVRHSGSGDVTATGYAVCCF